MANNLPSDLMTTNQRAAYLQVPPKTIAAWRYRRTGPPFHRIGRHVRYSTSDVRAWLSAEAGR